MVFMQQNNKGRSGEPSRLRDKLLLLNARTGLSQQGLAGLVGVSTAALRNWEAGQSKPTSQNLKRLIEIYVECRAFTEGEEQTEAVDLWEAAQERGLKVPFDEQWFQELLVNQQGSHSEVEREHKHEPQSELDQEPEHAQERHWVSDTEARDNRPGAENANALRSQPPEALPSSSSHALSRRTMLVGLTCLIVGGAAGSSLTWAALRSQTRPLPQAQWRQTGTMLQARSFFRATLLNTGLVLIEGGIIPDKLPTAQSELFDAKKGTWIKTGMLNYARAKHTATLLQDGKVLITGGIGTTTTNSAELYVPETETWRLTKHPMGRRRVKHTATLLRTGKVLVVGGVGDNTTELYDPAADAWSMSGNMMTRRYDHVAIPLRDGNVLVAGGRTRDNDDKSITNSAELYNLDKKTWTSLPSMNSARADFTAALLPDGKVLVIGGLLLSGDPTPTTEIYDPNTGGWLPGAPMKYARQNPLGQEAVQHEDGTVLVIGGDTHRTSEIYSPNTETWGSSLKLSSQHYLGATASLGNGQALVAGGFDVLSIDDKRRITTSAEIYSPATE